MSARLEELRTAYSAIQGLLRSPFLSLETRNVLQRYLAELKSEIAADADDMDTEAA